MGKRTRSDPRAHAEMRWDRHGRSGRDRAGGGSGRGALVRRGEGGGMGGRNQGPRVQEHQRRGGGRRPGTPRGHNPSRWGPTESQEAPGVFQMATAGRPAPSARHCFTYIWYLDSPNNYSQRPYYYLLLLYTSYYIHIQHPTAKEAHGPWKRPKPVGFGRWVQRLSHEVQQYAGPIPPNRGRVRRGAQRLGGSVTLRSSLKNSKSAIKLLQVVLASAPTAKTRVFASKHAQRRHPPQA
jgi:hypothetical protein